MKGQRSGISWQYLRILAGVQDVKADRMIRALIADTLGRSVEPSEARELVIAAHARVSVDRQELDLRTLDHPSGPTSAAGADGHPCRTSRPASVATSVLACRRARHG